MGAGFARVAGTDAYQMTIINNAGAGSTLTGTTTVAISGSAIGVNFAGGQPTSNALQLSFQITEGGTKDAWTLVATLQNITTGIAYTATATLAGAASAFWSSTLDETIQSNRTSTDDGLSTFTITQFDTPYVGGPAGTYQTFRDDFTTGSLDGTKWVPFYTQAATINNELEVNVPQALTFPAGGGLSIKADHPATPVEGQAYTSGCMTTYGNFSQTYGYFEMKAQMPKGAGFWPAFWLLADNLVWPPEIDVVEMPQSNNPAYGQPLNINTDHTTLHWLDANNTDQQASVATTTTTDYSAGYHTYAVSLAAELDGLLPRRQGDPDDQRLAGAQRGRCTCSLTSRWAAVGPARRMGTTVFPAYMKVAYVHAYQYNSAPAGPKANFVFTPTTLSAATVAPGGKVTVSSSLKLGPKAPGRWDRHRVPHPILRWVGRAPTYASSSVSLGAKPANSTMPFSTTLTIPTTLAAGTYTIYYYLQDANVSGGLNLAQRVTVN